MNLKEINDLINNCEYEKANEELNKLEGKTNYYEVVYLRVKANIGLNKLEEAIKILDEELGMPYVPMDYEDTFRALKREVEGLMKQMGNVPMYDFDESLIESTLESNDVEGKLDLLIYFKDANIRKYINHFQKWLTSEGDEVLKSLFLMTCVEQQIMEEIEINKDGFNITVIPYELEKIENSKILASISNELQELIGYLEPSLLQICFDIMDLYFINVYPLLPDVTESKAISVALVSVALSSMSRDEEISKYLEQDEEEKQLIINYIDQIQDILEKSS